MSEPSHYPTLNFVTTVNFVTIALIPVLPMMLHDAVLSVFLPIFKLYLQCKRPGFNPWVMKIPWRMDDNPLQYSCLENSMDGGAGRLQAMGSQRVDSLEKTLMLGGIGGRRRRGRQRMRWHH